MTLDLDERTTMRDRQGAMRRKSCVLKIDSATRSRRGEM